MGAAYHLFVFTQYVDDPKLQYKFGWSIIAVTTLNIIVNMGVMGYTSFQKLKLQFRKLKQRYLLWKLTKAKKE
jgi:5,10-methylenetetrahydrofolate reductase